jgi:diguanylate cyclase (GGDEF)-like protein/PAS domain S-box-containing protein
MHQDDDGPDDAAATPMPPAPLPATGPDTGNPPAGERASAGPGQWPVVGFLIADAAAGVIGVDGALAALLARSPAELIGQPLAHVLPGLAPEALCLAPRPGHHRLALTAPAGGTQGYDAWVSTLALADRGEIIVVALGAAPAADTERRVRLDHLAAVVEQTEDLVMITDAHSVVQYVNPAFERCTGYRREEILGQKPSMLKSGHHSARFYQRLWRELRAGRPFRAVFVNRRRSGELYHEAKTISPIRDRDGRITHFVSTGKDDTERAEVALALEHAARTDELTGLPNRRGLTQHFEGRLSASPVLPFAVAFIDIDRFKRINDALGHGMGDAVLREVGERLRAILRPADFLARISGDEFIAVLDQGASGRADPALTALLRRLLTEVHRPIEASPHALFISVSIGVACHPEDGDDATVLMRRADLAMYAAKHTAHGSYRFFSPELERTASRHLLLESGASEALLDDQMHLVFQPLWGLAEGRVVALEALLRWRHPELGSVSPGEFIPVLEDTGLILEIGRWVFETALAALARVRALGFTDLGMAVNLSPVQLRDPLLVQHIAACLEAAGIPPRLIEVEITESAMIESSAEVKATLHALTALGLRLTLDDFGTGYSSIGTLKRLSFEALKIGQHFVWDAASDPQSRVILEAMLRLAHALHMPTTAEGVETATHYRFLRSLDCHRIQGYLVRRPAPLEEIISFLETPDFPPPNLH